MFETPKTQFRRNNIWDTYANFNPKMSNYDKFVNFYS